VIPRPGLSDVGPRVNRWLPVEPWAARRNHTGTIAARQTVPPGIAALLHGSHDPACSWGKYFVTAARSSAGQSEALPALTR
jgi:hypothetical protein